MDKLSVVAQSALRAGNASALLEALNTDANLKSDDNLAFMLKKACSDNKLDVAKMLVEQGAKPTPLIAWNAAYCEAEDTLFYLFDQGITIQSIEALREMSGSTFFELICRRPTMAKTLKYVSDRLEKLPELPEILRILNDAAKDPKGFELIKYFTEEHNISPTTLEEQFPTLVLPIHNACENSNVALVKYLIEKGADPFRFIKDADEKWHASSPFFSSIGRGRNEADSLELLEYFKTLPGFDINMKSPKNNTPLHVAVKGRQKKVITAIFNAGGDTNAENDDGKKPADMFTSFDEMDAKDMARFVTKLFAGRVKRKADGPVGDEANAKKAKTAEENPIFHTIEQNYTDEWTVTLEDYESDDDTGKDRNDGGKKALKTAMLTDLATMPEDDDVKLARRLGEVIGKASFETEASIPWVPFLIEIPKKRAKDGVMALIKKAIRAPKMKLSTTSYAKKKNYFHEDNEDHYDAVKGQAEKDGTQMMKENLKAVSKFEGSEEDIVFPVFVAGKNKKGDKVIGVFAYGVYT